MSGRVVVLGIAAWVGLCPAGGSAAPAVLRIGAARVVEAGPEARADAVGDPAALRALLPLGSGDRYEPVVVDAAAAAVRDRFDAAGYATARIIVATSPALDGQPTIDVAITVRRGPPCVIGSVAIVGVEPARAARMTRGLGLGVGRRYSRRAGEAARAWLARALGDPVDLAADTVDPAGRVAVVLTVRSP